MAAFDQAARQGASAVELDVRTCAGNAVVVFHDATLSRATEGHDVRRVRDVGLDELRTLGVPTLPEVLGWAVSRRVGVNVEMKHDVTHAAALSRATVGAVRATGADVLLSSFDPLLLALAALEAPAIPRALLVRPGQPLWADALQQVARPPLVRWLHIERTQAQPDTMARHARRGLRLGVWTVNDEAEAVHLVDRGAASIITDAPGAIRSALGTSTLNLHPLDSRR